MEGNELPGASIATSSGQPVIDEREVEFTAIRAQGAGGQNVNKVSSAIQLRFPILGSSLPTPVKERLLALHDRRITTDGVVVMKAQRYRTQERNRADALERLQQLVDRAAMAPVPRRATRPTRASRLRRLDEKKQRGQIKALRGPIDE